MKSYYFIIPMDPLDPICDKVVSKEYAIVVDMAEYLVPDVCRIIMAELELIHIDLGWQRKMAEMNTEYRKAAGFFGSILTMTTGKYSCKVNFRDEREEMYIRNFNIWNFIRLCNTPKSVVSRTRAMLPPNYYHARLYD